MTLDEWLSQSPLKDHEFADAIGVSRVTLFRFKTRRRIPDRDIMESIHRETGGAVSPNDFFDLDARQPAPAASEAGEAA